MSRLSRLGAIAALSAACSHGNTLPSAVLDATVLEPTPVGALPDAPSSLHPDDVAALAVRKNATLDAARAALRAKVITARAAGSLPEPMAAARIAPLSAPALVGAGNVPFGVDIMLAQPVVLSGRLDDERAQLMHDAERDAVLLDELALLIARDARVLACDAWRIARARALHIQHLTALHTLQAGITERVAGGLARVDDALALDEEIAAARGAELTLLGEDDIARARLNALLHRAPDAPLPEPPTTLSHSAAPVGADRPLVRAMEYGVLAARAEKRVAESAFIPDFTVQAGYSSMWPDVEHQLMVGVSIELPIQRARRSDAVAASDARIDALERERAATIDATRADILAADRRVTQARALLDHQRQQVLPAAERRRAQAEGALASAGGSVPELLAARAKERGAALDVVEAQAAVCRADAEQLFARAVLPPALVHVVPGEDP